MSGELTLALDAGTGSCRAAVFDADGRQLAIGQREWAHEPEPGVPGSRVFDTAANWRLVAEGIREALSAAAVDPARIAAVAATSMREGMVLWDAAGRELWACPNVDSRASAEAVALIESGDAERIFALAGDWVAITAPARFRWLAAHRPKIVAATRRVGMLSDWMTTRLCGEFATDPTIGSSSGMFDLGARTWSTEILALVGVDPAIVPPVLEAGTPLGGVTVAAAAETGLRVGTPVVVGGADTQLGLAGIAQLEAGGVTVIGGTFWQQTCVLDAPLVDPGRRLRTLCHAAPDRWMIEGIGFLSGLAMRWFRDAFCDVERRAAQRDGGDAYGLMEALAAQADCGAGGVVGLFSNTMTARQWVHAAPGFLGVDVTDPRSSRGACIRAIEEAAAYVTRAHVETIDELTAAAPQEVVFTGGAAKGELWPQILADVLGLPVHVPEVKESSSLGAVALARVGLGLDDDLGDLCERAVRFERTFAPDPARHARYDELYASWRALYEHVLTATDAGGINPLWKAAGT